MRKIIIGAVAVAMLGALVSAGAMTYWRQKAQSPQYSIAQIRLAVQTHDVPLFEKHVDVTRLTQTLASDLLETAPNPPSSNAMAALIARQIRDQLAATMPEQLKQATIRLVETGKFEIKHPPPPSLGQGIKVDMNVTDFPGFQGYFGEVVAVEVQGKRALVSVNYHLPDQQAPMVLIAAMRDMDGYWQVVEFTNVRELQQEFAKKYPTGRPTTQPGAR